ncbi:MULTISPECIES: NUDIX hydrolase [unclassified Pseudomonas]|uniref:NUDIX hydrolase n=1 Tax=unclassified Pseudomonas TaxID=196821 RepID=UPI00111C30A3|nr:MULTISPECIES: NUDIX hydrolase [unclassified Pseudomonas]
MYKGIFKHVLLTLAILYLYDLTFKTSEFYFQLIGALIVNVLFWDLTTKRYLTKFSAPFTLIWKWKAKIFLTDPSPQNLTKLKDFFKRWILKDDSLTREFIDGLSDKSAAALVITLQGEKDIKQSSSLKFSDFKTAVSKASKWHEYRRFLLKKATSDFPSTQKIVESLTPLSDYVIGDDLKLVSDDVFSKKLDDTDNEIIHIFTTTSQLSSDFITTISNHKEDIKTLHFYICSPYIDTHQSLLDLKQEYENPAFTRQWGQFVDHADYGVNIEADMIRRMIKILGAIRELSKLSKDLNIELHLFTERYPGVKIKMLEQQGYAQIQPGPLTYANNIYRFAVDVVQYDQIKTLKEDLKNFRESNQVETIKLDSTSRKAITEQAIKEMCQWLYTQGFTSKELSSSQKRIRDTAKDPESDKIINDISRTLLKVSELLKTGDQVSEIMSPDGTVTHFSVALMIEQNKKILLIKKSDSFYQEKYSIVAGHVNRHETPVEAIHREVYEELGVTLTSPQLIAPAFLLDDACRHGGNRHLWFVFKAQLTSQNFILDSSEISYDKFVPVEKLSGYTDKLTPGALGVLKQLGYLS